jgi:hypothetical protein
MTLTARLFTSVASTVLCGIALVACGPEPAGEGKQAPAKRPPAKGGDAPAKGEGETAKADTGDVKRWAKDAKAIAKGYTHWGRVDDEARWAPGLCRMPMPSYASFSESADEGTHGGKLYTLYAKDPVAYGAKPSGPRMPDATALAKFAQVLVKEAWVPVALPRDETQNAPSGHMTGWGRSGMRPAVKDGVSYGADVRQGLYLMFKLDPKQPQDGTDQGWVYATLAPTPEVAKDPPSPFSKPEAWTVTAAGKLASCMECHVDADGKGGRLFGLPEGSWAAGGK